MTFVPIDLADGMVADDARECHEPPEPEDVVDLVVIFSGSYPWQ